MRKKWAKGLCMLSFLEPVFFINVKRNQMDSEKSINSFEILKNRLPAYL